MMFKWIYIVCFCLQINNISQCVGYTHLITHPLINQENGLSGYTFLERVLFVRNSTMPMSYVVGFKYVGDVFSTLIYSGTIHSNAQNAYASGDLSNGIGLHDNHYLNAEIHISNATNFQVDVELRGMTTMGYVSGLSGWLGLKIFRPRSSALICAIDKSQPKTKHRQIIFGARKDGDFILYARKEIISLTGKELPRHKIEFEDSDAIITAAVVRLNSTRAVVFPNKVELKEHRFLATIYGRSDNMIASTVIIYGHQI